MNGISSAIEKEVIYYQILEEEKECFHDILLNDIWDTCEDTENEGSENNYQVDANNFIFSNMPSNIFENYEEDETYNKVVNLLNNTETNNVDDKIEENDNFISGITSIDIKNYMTFDPMFIKIYHESRNIVSGTAHNTANSNSYNVKENFSNEEEQNEQLTNQRKLNNEIVAPDESDDEIYTPKALKLKKKKKSYLSDDTENITSISTKKIIQKKGEYSSDDRELQEGEKKKKKKKGNYYGGAYHNTDEDKDDDDADYVPSTNVSKKKGAFSNALDVLVKRKNEKNEEAIKAFNYINLKKRNRNNVLKSGNSNNNDGYNNNENSKSASRNDKRDEKRKNCRKNMDDSKDMGEEVPEQYMHLIEQGLDVNVVRYALSMKINSNEQVKETDIIGLHDIKKIIKDKIVNVILRPDLFTGLNRAAKGILLFGPPGTGKTMIAKWVASSCKCSFYNVNTSSLFSKYIGETEKIVTSLFKCAEVDNPSILFFDEIDSFLGMRKKDEDDTTIRIKNQLLQMIDGINTKKDVMIVIIGATNRPDMIDDAALRRFNKRVYIPLPDLQARKDQIRYILSKHTHSGFKLTEQELDNISHKLVNWNGSDIYHLCSKCYEYVYDDAVEKYNGIQNIPNTSIFRAIKYDDFIKALKQVNTSYKNVFDYDEWSKMHSSL
ncbi:AAA family ATPase, putative [Plasmodium malariae]|uniref:AAA family ATPase, putative n=1 Tax=Plasmodium malariae TaxID=5858 RepID=A0A1C3KA16_PLAMA|nr:AAA family ATPase, putative [Plasmodium malariae]